MRLMHLKKHSHSGNIRAQNIVHLVAGKEVAADCDKTDRYGRQVRKVRMVQESGGDRYRLKIELLLNKFLKY